MKMNESNNQQGRNESPENGMGAMRHNRTPIIVNRVNVVLDGNRMGRIRQACRFSDAGRPGDELSHMDRKANRFFHRGFPRFNDADLTPEEERSRLEQQEKWLQKRLAAVQNRLKVAK